MGMFGLWLSAPGPRRRRERSAAAGRGETSGGGADPDRTGRSPDGTGGGRDDAAHRRVRDLAAAARAATDPEARARAGTELRHALRGLCDLVLADGMAGPDLGASVRGLAAAMPFRVVVTVDVAPAPAVATTAYAVICEALANVAGHAQARRAVVTVRRHGRTVQVAVADDGVGGAQPVIGGGIVMVAARVAALGGLLHLDSPAGSGTHLTVELPAG
ncbi:hypothetical protein AB0J72_46495 [Dactylosporangium sp. NPDC049742]|uniref:sensor histidine kinase n=1 Tax=Dactylosporangium sp. NPDC049742 TaxID=3154737 RepID=UPI003432067E